MEGTSLRHFQRRHAQSEPRTEVTAEPEVPRGAELPYGGPSPVDGSGWSVGGGDSEWPPQKVTMTQLS